MIFIRKLTELLAGVETLTYAYDMTWCEKGVRKIDR